MTELRLERIDQANVHEVADIVRGYRMKQFHYRLQGIDQSVLARYHVEALLKRVEGGGTVYGFVRDSDWVGLAGLGRHAWHSEVFGRDIWVASPLLFRDVQACEVASALELLMEEARGAGAELLAARVDVADWPLLQGLGLAGWLNVGTSVKLVVKSQMHDENGVTGVDANGGVAYTATSENGVTIQECKDLAPGQAEAVASLARSSHTQSHFFNDPGLDPADARRLFESWAVRCAGFGHATTYLAMQADRILGFAITLVNRDIARFTGDVQGVVDFIAVDPNAQGAGIGSRLLASTLRGLARHAAWVEVRTMLENHAALRLYQKHGAVLASSDVHFHGWLTPRRGGPPPPSRGGKV